MLLLGASRHAPPLLQLALLLALTACPIVGVAMAKVVAVHRIDARSAWFYVGRPFLDSF